MNRFLKEFQNQVSWFNHQNKPLETYEISSYDLTTTFKTTFPELTRLIDASFKTGIEMDGKSMILFTWELDHVISGWMCQLDSPRVELIAEHRILIDNIGGIIESFNGPTSVDIDGRHYNTALHLNQYFMFVGSMCSDHTDCDWYAPYLDWCNKIHANPIDISNAVFFTREANGDNFFYDRTTKEVKLFAHDTGYQYVDPEPDQPERSLYTINGLTTFDEFVELLAKQWLSYLTVK